VTLTEKITSEKVSLLTQKNLYGAAISMAFADPSYQPTEIAALYRRHAEHLYRKGDFNAAMQQYIYTIGSLESSHVIFRYLDAPKIPMLTKYLEELRSRNLATPVYNELLRARLPNASPHRL
jgi:vacuolar protein sorting-associated protein 11